MGYELEKVVLKEHEIRPESQLADFIKIVYQFIMGQGHSLGDFERVHHDIQAEYALDNKAPLIERLGAYCRLNLPAARKAGLSAETVARLFMISSEPADMVQLDAGLETLVKLCELGNLPFDAESTKAQVEKLTADKSFIPRHSQIYKQTYKPSYRLIKSNIALFIPLFAAIDRLVRKKERIWIAIDGMCASGKTTLGALLKEVYNCNVISADSFFLRPEQRSEQRLKEPGGNIDYERFYEQVAQCEGSHVKYGVYDCRRQGIFKQIELKANKINVVEGAYCQNPKLGMSYDLRIFMRVNAEEQKKRILNRNGKEMLQIFLDKWIPMEHKYFYQMNIEEGCHMVFET